MSLKIYKKKRRFDQTPEPKASQHTKGKKLRFVVQEHHASHLHWDFRLEMERVLKSWAIPKGPSMDPSVKHLAVHVEDHPYSYRTFAGVIPKGNYGAGKVMIWDEGTYEPIEQTDNPEKTLLQQLKKGDLKFVLHGKKLKGEFALVKMGHQEKNWLLIKHKDSFAISSVIPDLIGNPELDSRLRGNDIETSGNDNGIKKVPMPHEIKPMLANLADTPFDDPDWIYEIKWDGYRAIAEVQSRSAGQKSKVRLYSRNNQDFTKAYARIVKALEEISHDVILDGEIVAVDKDGKAQFQLMQEARKNSEIQLIYYVFDLLYLDGYDLRDLPLIERKSLLENLLPQKNNVKYSDHIEEHGLKVFAFAKKKGLEGIIAKRKGSRYVSMRSSEWQKIKHIQVQEAVICGFTEPRGQRKEFGALILGLYDHGEYRYIGHTGGGFDEKKLQEIIAKLKPLATEKSPFALTPKTNAPATWVKPKLIAQVKFSEWTKDGVMRQPVFLGLRTDKKPEEVAQEVKGKQEIKTKAEFSNLDKIFWPDMKYTKGDLVAYYDRIASTILPYLKDRPESMLRQPDGIHGESFFQKDLLKAPSWVKRVPIQTDDKTVHWVICNDRDTLLFMANLGCIEINPWSSRLQTKNKPDYLIIDLDPNQVEFAEVVNTAKVVKKILDTADLPGFLKTSGKRGIHILIPLGANYSFDQTRQFAEIIARIVTKELPHTTSVLRNPEKREKKIYIDFLQNRVGQTITAPYSLRPVPFAPVSTPLEWKELTADLHPTDFTIKNIFRRLGRKGDIWKGLLTHKGINMLKSLDILHKEFPSM